MKITFEDHGAKLEVELPTIDIKRQMNSIKDMPCVRGFDAEIEMLSALEMELSDAITKTTIDVGPDKARLLRLVVMFLPKIDPGTSVKLDTIVSKVFKRP